jgi:phosphopantothenoylcysteine synthetase/decarboxylase
LRYSTTYLIVSGASTARRAPGLAAALTPSVVGLTVLLTTNAQRVVSPRELALVPGVQVIESYFDDAILPRPPEGVVLFAPCSFNSLNKLAGGIADSLPLSLVSEAIGRGTPVVVAVSVNDPLWAHPITTRSVATLRGWGVTVIDPVPDANGYLTMASDQALVEEVLAAGEGRA